MWLYNGIVGVTLLHLWTTELKANILLLVYSCIMTGIFKLNYLVIETL